MSSRRERSWEREDRSRNSRSSRGSYRGDTRDSRRRSSRSRSPRRSDRDRRDYRERDRRDYRDVDRRDRDRERDDDRRDRGKKEDSRARDRDRDHDKVRDGSSQSKPEDFPMKETEASDSKPSHALPNLDPDADTETATPEDDDAALMAMMGLGGFGSTKGKQVEGNQEGTVNIKKQRTWRQYMNRRGGFNRPLDKIK